MSPIPLRDHPLDIQQYIIESIDSPRDLLALALSSKHYHDLIVPYHIQFRTLRCSVQRTDIWAALSVKKYLCARFRTLEIIHCPHSRYWYSDIVPSCVVNRQSQARAPLCRIIPPPADEEERQRKAVIDDICVVCQSMTSLQSFRWFDGVEVDNALMPRLNEILSAIYQSGPQLRSMIILSSVPSILDRPSNFTSTNISQFSFGYRGLTPIICSQYTLLDVLIQQCPHLQDLEIQLEEVNIPFLSTLFTGKWPRLSRFTLNLSTSLWIQASDELQESFAVFVETHKCIESLVINFPPLISPQCVNLGLHPNLRHLFAPRVEFLDHLFPRGVPDTLEYLNFHGTNTYIPPFSDPSGLHTVVMAMNHLEAIRPSLRALPSTIRRFKLSVPMTSPWLYERFIKISVDILPRFSQLTHLGGLLAAIPSLNASSVALPRIRLLVSSLPLLEFIEMNRGNWGDHRNRGWYQVIRKKTQSEIVLIESKEIFNTVKDEFFTPLSKANLVLD